MPHPYHIQWLSDVGEVKVSHMVKIHFKIGDYKDTVDCEVVPMLVYHLLLGRPWQFDRRVFHDVWKKCNKLKWNDKAMVLHPLTPTQIVHADKKKLPVKNENERKR
jgi:hypothetical protein